MSELRRAISAQPQDRLDDARLADGRHLSFWRQRRVRVPDVVCESPDLESLVLAENELTEIPDDIGRLTKLRMLDLGHNKLARIPEAIGHLVSLTDFLYLHDNQFSSLHLRLGS
jgi:Leucine-rich repeat (LRR) protein